MLGAISVIRGVVFDGSCFVSKISKAACLLELELRHPDSRSPGPGQFDYRRRTLTDTEAPLHGSRVSVRQGRSASKSTAEFCRRLTSCPNCRSGRRSGRLLPLSGADSPPFGFLKTRSEDCFLSEHFQTGRGIRQAAPSLR